MLSSWKRRLNVTVVCGAPCGLADDDEDRGPRRYSQALLLCVLMVLRPVRATTASAGSRGLPAPALGRRGESLDRGREARPGHDRLGGGPTLRAARQPAVRLAPAAAAAGSVSFRAT